MILVLFSLHCSCFPPFLFLAFVDCAMLLLFGYCSDFGVVFSVMLLLFWSFKCGVAFFAMLLLFIVVLIFMLLFVVPDS